jgi:hypothetical protein
VLVPVRFDNARLPIDFRALHTTDLDDWAEDSSRPAFRSLCKALESKLGPVCAKMGKERLEWLKSDPGLDPIRDDERFKTMIATAERRLAASNS